MVEALAKCLSQDLTLQLSESRVFTHKYYDNGFYEKMT